MDVPASAESVDPGAQDSPWLAPYLSEPLGNMTALQMECLKQVEGVKKQMEEGTLTEMPTIFSSLLTHDQDKPDDGS